MIDNDRTYIHYYLQNPFVKPPQAIHRRNFRVTCKIVRKEKQQDQFQPRYKKTWPETSMITYNYHDAKHLAFLGKDPVYIYII